MITVYRVHNPYQGTYSDADNFEQAKELLAKAAWESYMTLCHGTPLATVTVHADGSQTWGNPEQVMSPELNEEEMQSMIADFISKDQVLPLTIENKNG